MLEPNPAFAMADRIAQLQLDGFTASEIAKRLGLSRQQVYRVLARSQFEMQLPRGSARLVGARLPAPQYAVVRSLAERAQVSPAIMLVRIARCILDEGHQAAARRLGKHALPKRGYQRRTA